MNQWLLPLLLPAFRHGHVAGRPAPFFQAALKITSPARTTAALKASALLREMLAGISHLPAVHARGTALPHFTGGSWLW